MRALALVVALFVPVLAGCQAGYDARLAQARPPVSVLILPPPVAADSIPARKGVPYQFATAVALDVSPAAFGDWSTARNARWRLDLLSAGATSLGLRFDRLWLPPGARLRVYSVADPDQSVMYTATTGSQPKRVFTPTFPGDRLALELTLPAAQKSHAVVHIDSAFVGFR